MDTIKILIIIPAYNEEKNIEFVIDEIKMYFPYSDILVVDDGSVDKTAEIAMSKGVYVIRHSNNLGIGAAMQTGYKFAADREYDIAIQVDGDGQHSAYEVKGLVSQLHNSKDMVIGSRYLSENSYNGPILRRTGTSVLSAVIFLTTGYKITDPTSGFRAVNKKLIKNFAKYYPHDYPEPEVIIFLKRAQFRIEEIPVVMRERKNGKSSIVGWRRPLYYMLKVILAIFVDIIRENPYKNQEE